jgi:osmotically-inducible protein OsmY
MSILTFLRGRKAAIPATILFLSLSGCATTAFVGAAAVTGHSVMEERSTRDAMTDGEIRLSLNNKLLSHSSRLFSNVSTEVVEGRVLLTGSVPRREDRIDAGKLAWEVEGVREVVNEIEVGEDVTATAFLEDVWITSQLRARLIADRGINSVNFNIETVNKTVHLIGLAQSRAELDAVVALARKVPGVKRVVSHVLTIDDLQRGRTAATT